MGVPLLTANLQGNPDKSLCRKISSIPKSDLPYLQQNVHKLKEMFPSLREKMDCLSELSTKSFSKILYDLAREILTMEDGREFLTNLQTLPPDFVLSIKDDQEVEFPIFLIRTKKMLKWKRDKSCIVFFKTFLIFELNFILRDMKRDNFSEKAEEIRNWISKKENLKALAHKDTLILESLNLLEIPSEIENFTFLRTLHLNENRLVSLPPQIGQLTSLNHLSLEGNRLVTLPEEIGLLTSLMSLNLARNRLSSLPKSIENLNLLLELDLTGNPLTFFLQEMCGLGNLICLIGVSGNQLPSFLVQIIQRMEMQFLTFSTTRSGCSLLRINPPLLRTGQLICLGGFNAQKCQQYKTHLMEMEDRAKESIFASSGIDSLITLDRVYVHIARFPPIKK